MSDDITRGWRSWRRWDGQRWTAAGAPGAASGLPLEAEPAPGALPQVRLPIQTHHIYPPIPIREFDWCAYRDPEKTPYGYGRTEAEAIADLLSLEDEDE